MKKVVFAIQVFCLIAMFPVYMIVELNQGAVKKPVDHSTPDLIEKTEKNNIQPALSDQSDRLSFLLFS